MTYTESLAADGRPAFRISRRLDEMRRLSRRITVLRDGVQVGEMAPEDAPRERRVTLMAGRPPKAAAQVLRRIDTAQTLITDANVADA